MLILKIHTVEQTDTLLASQLQTSIFSHYRCFNKAPDSVHPLSLFLALHEPTIDLTVSNSQSLLYRLCLFRNSLFLFRRRAICCRWNRRRSTRRFVAITTIIEFTFA